MGKIKHSCHNYPLFPDDDDFSLKILFSTEDINKSSAELPAEIQHFFHSSHSLALHAIEGNAAVNCDVCQGSWRGFTYRCKDCDFKMDVECAKLQPEIQLSIHPEHPLKLQVGDTETDSHFYCDFCNNRCYSDQGRTFHCKHCSFKIDLDCARMLLNSEQIKHVSHEHWLGLDLIQYSERKYNFSKKKEYCLSKEKKYCSACREECHGATYCCKRCHFFLHKSCAEYPTRIKLSLHSDHPLTLGTGTTRERCNFCNLICRALTFRCDMCNFKIDFTCACMLIQFCESVTNGNDIEHYSDQHKLSFWGYGPMDDDAHCYACKKPVSFKFYYCFNCSFYLHSSCSIDLIEHYRDNYKQIQTSFHEHPLEIVYYNSNVSDDGAVCCSVCGNRCLGPTYVCFLCRFELHESCLGQVQRINQKSFHKHPLVMIENKHPLVMIENKVNYYCSATCSACGEPDLDTTFICLICKFYFDGSCLGLPKEIQHSFHPCPLTLRQETTEFTCRACGKTRTQFAFHCDRCHFYLDVECAQMFTGIFEDQEYFLIPRHGHPLTLCNKEKSGDVVFCYGCSKTSSGQEIYGCVKCDFYLHRSCAASPKQIKHHFHPNHTLTLTYDDHDAWCKVSILKTLDERGEVKYLRHKHFSNSHDKQNVCCDACEKRICGPSYDCSRCNFFVHQHCLEPAEELQNPLHLRDRQIGVSRKSPFTRTVKCDACQYHCSGFYYRCDGFKSTRNKPLFNSMIEHELDFVLHVDCASLKPSVKYEGHEHLLTFLEKMHDDPKCEVCKTSYRDVSYLRCVECDYNVHFLCVPLPCTIKHKCHIDPLHLRDYFVEDDSGEYYCDACEESRDPGECVYHCAECSNYVAHLNCVLDEVLLSLGEKRGDVEFRIVNRYRGLTLENIFNSSNEDDQKEFEGVEVAISDLIRERMSRAEFMSNHFLDNVNCSDETFIPVLRNVSFGHFEIWIKDFSEMTFWELDSVVVKVELESEVVKVGHYMISQNFVPILKSIFNKHGDICAKSTLKRETKTRFLNMFCGVVYSMCNTMAKDINRNLLLNWWKNFKLVEHAGFNIQFAFDHLYKVTQSLISVVRACDTDRTIYDYRRKMNNQTTELEKLKVQLTDHINSKTGKSIPEKQSLIEDFELFSKMHMVGTGLL